MKRKIITDRRNGITETRMFTVPDDCANCGGIHYGSLRCPYAVPYDGDDPLGIKRGLQHTASTMRKEKSP